MPITNEQVKAAYIMAKDEYEEKISSEQAANNLVAKHGWNENSAYGYIHTFLCMMNGNEYQRTINIYATEYYLRNIYSDFGKSLFNNAISAVQKHLDYYEGKGKSSQPKIQTLLKTLIIELNSESEFKKIQKIFYQNISESLLLDKKARDIRLNSAPKKPRVISVTTKVYSRNPDVVAAVLIRANGVCEKCNKPAPFIRANGNSPYLEVHHKHQLAKGGDDTVENAIALCPNCHRESHYGI